MIEEFTVGMGIPPRPPRELVDTAVQSALSTGCEIAWMIDHFSSFVPQSIWNSDFSEVVEHSISPDRIFEYQTVLGYVAAKAPEIRVAVGVTDPFRRHPALLAQAIVTLSHLSDRPPILGIGAGERENLEPFGWEFDRPVSRLEEAIRYIRLCMESVGPFDFAGEFFVSDSAILDLEVGPGGVPEIWIGAHGPRSLGITGRLGDGWFPTVAYHPDEYASSLRTIAEAAEEIGRDLSSFTPGLQCMTVISETQREARALLDSKPVRLWALLMPASRWAELGYTHPLGSDHRGIVDFVPQSFDAPTIDTALDSVPAKVLEESVFWGTIESLTETIEELQMEGLRHISLVGVPGMVPSSPDSPTSVHSLARCLLE